MSLLGVTPSPHLHTHKLVCCLHVRRTGNTRGHVDPLQRHCDRGSQCSTFCSPAHCCNPAPPPRLKPKTTRKHPGVQLAFTELCGTQAVAENILHLKRNLVAEGRFWGGN